MNESKVWYKSKTILIMVAVNMLIAGWNQVAPHTSLSSDQVALINGLLATILRSVTTGPVTLKKTP